MQDAAFVEWMTSIQQRSEAALSSFLPSTDILPTRLHEAMRYSTLGGGKRVRALLVHAAGEITKASPDKLDVVSSAVELIHAYSLVHDDMPCMDDDVLRRGKPTTHVQFGEATALLAGDALQTLAFQLLASTQLTENPNEQLEMLALLASSSGSRGMAGGQAIDLEAVGHEITIEALELMHIHKTGALIRASVLLGAMTGTSNAQLLQTLDHFGKVVGLLFQVVDDILDEQSDTATLGKTAGKDAEHAKPTYVTLLGFSEARLLAVDLLRQAKEAISPLGVCAAHLNALANYIAHRKF